jgi:hypothetical protein
VRRRSATLLADAATAGAVACALVPDALEKFVRGVTGSTPTYAAIPATPAAVDAEVQVYVAGSDAVATR